MSVVTSRDDLAEFTPPGSPNAYTLAPLTYRQRQAFYAAMQREGYSYPSRAELFRTIRRVIQELAPANAAELLDMVAAAEADERQQDAEIQARLREFEYRIADQPAYAVLVAARGEYLGMQPFFAAKHALRGWQGEALPPFALERGVVPDSLLDRLPPDDLVAVGLRAVELMQPTQAAAKN